MANPMFPWFILGFLAMSGLTSLGLIPAALAAALKSVSKFLMVAALAAIGLNTDFKTLCKSGAKPMLHGFIISLLVVLVAIGVEYADRRRAERDARVNQHIKKGRPLAVPFCAAKDVGNRKTPPA